MIKVYIVDDHRIVIDGIQLMLQSQKDIQCIGASTNPMSAIEEIQKLQPDIILLDINMPEKNGIECCKEWIRLFPTWKIIALSMINELSMIKLMIKNGAKGYIVKNAGKEEVLEAIERVHSGKQFFSNEVQELLFKDLQKSKTQDQPYPVLSPREKEVALLILDEHTTPEIAQKLFISSGTVDTHRRNVMIKLGVKNTAGMVRVIMEYNLLK